MLCAMCKLHYLVPLYRYISNMAIMRPFASTYSCNRVHIDHIYIMSMYRSEHLPSISVTEILALLCVRCPERISVYIRRVYVSNLCLYATYLFVRFQRLSFATQGSHI